MEDVYSDVMWQEWGVRCLNRGIPANPLQETRSNRLVSVSAS